MLRALKLNHSLAMGPHSTQDATNRAMQILDAKYQQKKLLQLLKKYELLFDGTLGDWKTKPVLFKLREGVSPYHDRDIKVPKIHKDTIIK